MPIEFSCKSCNKLLRVPDGTEGKTCQCPSCNHVGVIPDLRPAQQRTSNPSSANAGGPTEDLADGLVRVTCPKCQYPLRCKSELLGTKGQCKQCKHIFVIGDTKVVPEDITAMVFSCPKCDQLFDGKPEMEGRKGKCHACGEVFHIKLRPAESIATTSTQSRDAKPTSQPNDRVSEPKPAPKPAANQSTQLNKASASPSKVTEPDPAKLQIICGSCQGMMQAPISSAGKKVTCPHCSQLLQVPGGPKQSNRASIFDETDEVLGVLETNTSTASSSPFSFGTTPTQPNSTYPVSNSNSYGNPPPMPYIPLPQYPPSATPYSAPAPYSPGPANYSAPDPYAPTTSAYQYLSAAESELVQDKSLARSSSSEGLTAARVILFSLAAIHFVLMGLAVIVVNIRIDRYLERHPEYSRDETIIGSYIVLGLTCFVCLSFMFFAFMIKTLPLLSSIAPLLLFSALAILLNYGELNWVRITIDLATICALLKVLFDGINYRH